MGVEQYMAEYESRMRPYIMQDKELMLLEDRFGPEIFRRSSLMDGLDDFLTEINIKGHTCVEIGTWNGLTAVLLSRRFRRVYSFDIVRDTLKHDVAEFLNIQNIEFIDVQSNSHKYQLLARMRFDCAYLDGDHANDTRADYKATRKCRRLIFHEYDSQLSVKELVGSLPAEEVTVSGRFAAWIRS